MNRHSKQPESYHKSSRNSHHDKSSVNKFNDSATKSKEKEAKHLKSAKRQCGDWTEHVSSKTGTTYYFNVTTSQSQWEKPKGWRDSHAKDVKPRKTPQKISYPSTTNHYNNHVISRNNSHNHNTPNKRPSHHYDVTTDSDFRSPQQHGKRDGDFRSRAVSDYDMRRSSLGNDKDFREVSSKLHDYNSHKTTDATQKGSNGCQLLLGNLRSSSASSAVATDSSTGKVFDYSQHTGSFRGSSKVTPMKPFNHMMSDSPYNSRNSHEHGSTNHKVNMMSSDSKRVNNFHDNHHQASPLLHMVRSNSIHNSTTQTPNNGPTPNSGHVTPNSVTLAISKFIQSVSKPRKRSRHDESPATLLESSSSKKTRTHSSHNEDMNNHVAEEQFSNNAVARRLSMQQSPQQPTMPMYQQQQQAQIDASDVFKSVNKLRHVVDPSLMQHAINWPTIHLEKEVMKKSRDLQNQEMMMWSLNTDLTKQRMSIWQVEAKKLLLQDQLKFLREERQALTSSNSSFSALDFTTNSFNSTKTKNNMMTSLQTNLIDDVTARNKLLLGNNLDPAKMSTIK